MDDVVTTLPAAFYFHCPLISYFIPLFCHLVYPFFPSVCYASWSVPKIVHTMLKCFVVVSLQDTLRLTLWSNLTLPGLSTGELVGWMARAGRFYFPLRSLLSKSCHRKDVVQKSRMHCVTFFFYSSLTYLLSFQPDTIQLQHASECCYTQL